MFPFPKAPFREYRFAIDPLAILLFAAFLVGSAHLARASRPGARAKAPSRSPAPVRTVDYIKQIHPLLQARCGTCHLNGNGMGGLKLDTREDVLRGGSSGAAAVPGKSGTSLLIRLVSGQDPARIMPASGPRLTPAQIALIRAWIDQGVSFNGAAAGGGRFYEAPLLPRHPALPAASAGAQTNPIDRLLTAYYRRRRVVPSGVVSDQVYARRVYLDLVGLLPSPAELHKFERDTRPDKRTLLAKRLLSDDRNYAIHWLSFWNDALRNDYTGAGYIDGGREQITRWLFTSLETNKPYNRFVSELVNPTKESEGFVKGIVWRGTVNASQTPQMQAAQNISQVFLGINLKCASCHDSFISNWKLKDAYGVAGIYADHALETVRCDRPTGQIAPVKFLYPQLGEIDASAPRAVRMEQLARALTAQADGRLTRTLVNRLWTRLMGRGLIEPNDEMDRKPWDADVLDWLASDFSGHGYDMKRTLLDIVTSRAYQLPSVASSESLAGYHFHGPVVKRMSAEQFADAVSTLTGSWPAVSDANLGDSSPPLTGHWIWNDPGAARAVPGERIYLRKAVDLPARVDYACAVMSCDNEFTLWVNGHKVVSGDAWQNPPAIDLRPYLLPGKNSFAVEAINWPDPVTGKGRDVASGPNAAGFVFFARIGGGSGATARVFDFGTDLNWKTHPTNPAGWETRDFDDSGWAPAFEVGNIATGYGLYGKLANNLRHALHPDEPIRWALVKSDALSVALGRPNREQVVTERSTAATTLQALELTNGRELAGLIQRGASNWLARYPPTGKVQSSRELVDGLYQASLGRHPSVAEMNQCLNLIGVPARPEGVEDLIWTLTMLPEFQLIL